MVAPMRKISIVSSSLISLFAALSGSMLLRGLRWRILLAADRPIPLLLGFWGVAVGYLGNNFLPARAGEVVRSAMVSRRTGLGTTYVLADADQHVGALGRNFGTCVRIGQQSRGRRNVFVFGQLIEGGVSPALSAKLGQGDSHGDLVNPGRELAAALKGIQLVEHAQQGFLRDFLHKSAELWLIRRQPT